MVDSTPFEAINPHSTAQSVVSHSHKPAITTIVIISQFCNFVTGEREHLHYHYCDEQAAW